MTSADSNEGRRLLRRYAELRARTKPQPCHACGSATPAEDLANLWENAFYLFFERNGPETSLDDLEHLTLVVTCRACYTSGACQHCAHNKN